MWGRTPLCLLAVVLVAQSETVRESRVVNITQGPIRGYKDPETGIYSFQSIPYATAPTGTHRFKAPLPAPVWLQPLDASDKGITCPQISNFIITGDKIMHENCLIVNVHVPDTQEETLPVVVYVHGGGYQIGYGDMAIPKKLMIEHNIITVTLNYRLGVHGFLCLGTEDIPGNAGMKDIVAALRWVKKNIKNFGGDSENIAIAGYSAGAAAVDLLMLSKSAEGLFNKVIPESGASIAPWSIQTDPVKNARLFAERLNFTDVNDIVALEELYKQTSFDVLLSISDLERKDSVLGLSPCVEQNFGRETFLDISPLEILKSGNYRKLPLLYGFANMEGLMRTSLFDSWKMDMNEKFSDFLPADLKFDSHVQKENVAEHIKQFYFKDKPVSEKNILSYVDYFSDVMFVYPALRTVKHHVAAGHDQIYLYEYSYVDENTNFVPHTNVKGADHGRQIYAVFNGLPGLSDSSNFTEEFINHAVVIRKLWANFIKTGSPVVDGSPVEAWPAVGLGWSPHMAMGNELKIGGPLLERRMNFWDDIYDKYYQDPAFLKARLKEHSEL